MNKKIKRVIMTVVVIVVIGVFTFAFNINCQLSAGAKVKLDGIDPSNLDDGTYIGSYESGRWSNTVSVEIKDGKITDIKIIDDVKYAKEQISNELLVRVIEEQNTDVDVKTGATVTSKAYLKAIENALNGLHNSE